MTSAPTVTVTGFLGIDATSSVFILDDPIRGLLDGATYVLGGDVGSDLSGYVRVANIVRGRARPLDEIIAGVATLIANNQGRALDTEHATGPFFGMVKPGVNIQIAANGVTIFDGLFDDLSFDYPISTDSTVQIDVADRLASLGSAEFNEWTTTGGQTVGARLTSILDRTDVQFPATRDLDTGTSTLQGDIVSWGSNVLNYAQLCVKSDLGQLFVSRDGVLTFYGRNRVVTGTGAPLFADDGTGIAYGGIRRTNFTELLFNRVSVDAYGFTKQTVVDQASIDEFQKIWSLSLTGLPLASEAQALDLANYLLNLYSQPQTRIASIDVYLHGLEMGNQNTVLNLDIGSVVRVIYTPNDVGVPLDKFCMVEGISHAMAPMQHVVTLHLSNLADGFGTTPFILDDAEFGLLDGTGRMGF